MRLRVAVLANLKRNAPHYPGLPDDAWDDLDSDVTVQSITEALAARGHCAEFLEGNLTLVEALPKFKPDLCFNLCEGHWGDGREAHVPAILEMLRIPYTGSKVLTLALTLDKPMTKRVLAFYGLPTPSFQVFEHADEALQPGLAFPLFVKPSREGTGMGVSADSVVHDETGLRERLAAQLARYSQPILVEQYIGGQRGNDWGDRQPGGRPGCRQRLALPATFGGRFWRISAKRRRGVYQPHEDRMGARFSLFLPGPVEVRVAHATPALDGPSVPCHCLSRCGACGLQARRSAQRRTVHPGGQPAAGTLPWHQRSRVGGRQRRPELRRLDRPDL